MLELGLRLAVGKPVIVVKDSETTYSFDTSPVEHIPYPSDLRFKEIIEFKSILTKKIEATQASFEKGTLVRFLQAFGPIEVPELTQEEVPAFNVIMRELAAIRQQMSTKANMKTSSADDYLIDSTGFMLGEMSEARAQAVLNYVTTDLPPRVQSRLSRNGSAWMAIFTGPLSAALRDHISMRLEAAIASTFSDQERR